MGMVLLCLKEMFLQTDVLSNRRWNSLYQGPGQLGWPPDCAHVLGLSRHSGPGPTLKSSA